MTKKVESKKNKLSWPILLPLFFLLLLGLLASFISFSKQGYYILGGDLYYPLKSSIDLLRTPFAWDVRYAAGGTSEARHIPSLVFFLYFFLLGKLSIPLIVSQKIAIFSIFALTAPAMYYLVLVIIQDQKEEIQSRDCLIAFISAFFYNFNLWNLFNWAAPSVHLALSYLATPLVLAFFIKGIKKFNFLYICLIAITYIFIAPAASNPIYFLNTLWPVAFFIVFTLAKHIFMLDWKGISKTLRFSFSVLAVIVLINFWWLLPMLSTLKASVSIEKAGGLWDWLNWKSARSSFLNIFRLTNHEAWVHTAPGSLILPSAHAYVSNYFLIAMSFLFPILAFSTLLKKKKEFYVLLFSVMTILMVFLAKGAHQPFGGFNKFLHQKILVLTLYRSVEWYTPIIVLGFAYLLGEGSLLIYDFLKGWKDSLAKVVLVTLIIAISAFNYPFWTGRVVHQGQWTGEIGNPYFVKIPPWYFEASRWINNQHDDFRIVSGPSITPYYHTDWGYSGGELGIFLFNKPIINNIFGWGNVEELSDIIIDSLNSKTIDKTFHLARILSIMNVKYVALRRDVADWTGKSMEKIDTYWIADRLKSQNNILLEKTIGKIEFFKNNEFLPHIFPIATPTVVAGGIGDLPLLLTLDDFQIKNGIFFSSLLKDQQKGFILSKSDEKLITNTPAVLRSKGKKFTVDRYVVPEEGEYEILVKVENNLKNKDLKILSLKMNGISVVSKAPLFRPDGWVSLGDAGFKKGSHRLSLHALNKEGKEAQMQTAYIVLRERKLANSVPPKMSFEKINPTKYVVRASGVANPYLLVFSESFHPGWKAYIRSVQSHEPEVRSGKAFRSNGNLPIWETWFRRPLPESRHFLVNGYANSWWIERPGNYEIILEFWPQRLFYLGVIVSAITLLSCIGYLIWDWRRTKIISSTLQLAE